MSALLWVLGVVGYAVVGFYVARRSTYHLWQNDTLDGPNSKFAEPLPYSGDVLANHVTAPAPYHVAGGICLGAVWPVGQVYFFMASRSARRGFALAPRGQRTDRAREIAALERLLEMDGS